MVERKMTMWNWQSFEGLPYLTCELLAGFAHGFFTRQWRPRNPTELTYALQSQAERAIAYHLKQVHGNIVLTPTEIYQQHPTPLPDEEEKERELPPGDGVLTETRNQGAWVCTADCVPALIADTATGQVAAAHAGWRGTAARIVPTAISRMQTQGSRIENLRVALGPAIAGSVYQVTSAVAAEVVASVLPVAAGSLQTRSTEDIAAILAEVRQFPDSPLLPDPQPGRERLDVRRVNALQLTQLGLTTEQMAIAPHCTFQTPDRFFSYRRQPERKVQWSGIISR